MKRWHFLCWMCWHSESGHYWSLPKRTCPKCRSIHTRLKRIEETPQPQASPAEPRPAPPLYKELF